MATKQASFFCRICNTQRLFTAHTMNHTPHILASVFLCGLWLPIWVLIAISDDPSYHCSQCGFTDRIKYLNNPRLRNIETERRFRAQQKIDSSGSISESFYAYLNHPDAWKYAGGVMCVIVFLFLGVIFSTGPAQPVSRPVSIVPTITPPVTEPRTSAELLSRAMELFSKRPATKAELDLAARYLRAIPKNAKEYEGARSLLKVIEKERMKL